MILNKTQILDRIREESMITEYVDLGEQLQPNGFDITIKDLSMYIEAGTIDFDNTERKIPRCLPFVQYYKYHLQQGAYLIDFNEHIRIPSDLIAIARTRSSLLRVGAHIPSSVWDAGFDGYSQGMLVVNNNYGINLIKNARVLQLIFMTRDDDESMYKGIYNEEKVPNSRPPLLDDPPEVDRNYINEIIEGFEKRRKKQFDV